MAQDRKRIYSIDALRAFSLFGILAVHTAQLYNFYNPYNDFSFFTATDHQVRNIIVFLFSDKCRTIFSILFGISFYLILRNPQYSIMKFCWRCLLLVGFGLINKVFFTTDILICYGLSGIILTILRNLSAKHLFLISILLYSFQFQKLIDFSLFAFPNADPLIRYISSISITDYIFYPFNNIIIDDIHTFLPGATTILSYFVLGYAMGKSGLIERIDKVGTCRNSLFFLCISITLRFLCHITDFYPLFVHLFDTSLALTYFVSFIYLHEKSRKGIMHPFQCYGKLGLTNYSMQNIICPILILEIAIPLKLSFVIIITSALLFYLFQILFAYLWLRRFKFGPWEYIWRKATNAIHL